MKYIYIKTHLPLSCIKCYPCITLLSIYTHTCKYMYFICLLHETNVLYFQKICTRKYHEIPKHRSIAIHNKRKSTTRVILQKTLNICTITSHIDQV
ncbi:hypothetical protein XENTR_v10008829 [Xenopus tropicalis]|nr:hypothetical protein XENTR_v10008829 [Xenopus tropicalis]